MDVEQIRNGRTVLTVALFVLLSAVNFACDKHAPPAPATLAAEKPAPSAVASPSPASSPDATDDPDDVAAGEHPIIYATAPSGVYARKSFWEHLPGGIWSVAIEKYNSYEISGLTIDHDRMVMGSAGWHEGYTPYGMETRDDGIWVEDSSKKWTGPFIRVGDYNGKDTDEEMLYFGQVFGKRCFFSETKEHWCFGTGAIEIDGQKYDAKLALDMIETPTFGNDVQVNGPKLHYVDLVFVPSQNGWKVFKDANVDDTGDKAPWHVLTPALPAVPVKASAPINASEPKAQ